MGTRGSNSCLALFLVVLFALASGSFERRIGAVVQFLRHGVSHAPPPLDNTSVRGISPVFSFLISNY